MNILIWTFVNSHQCAALKYSFDQVGIRVDLFSSADLPSKTNLSFLINQKTSKIKCKPSLLDIENKSYDTVINYRPFKADLPNLADKKTLDYLVKINERFLKSMQIKMAEGAFQINPLEAKDRCTSKALQLTTASEVDLIIPETIISNDAEEVLKFANPYERIVAKGLYPTVWGEEEDKKFSGQIISVLSQDEIKKHSGGLQHSPMIFQPYIEKAYELRVVVMGVSIFAIKINSQAKKSTTLDWRNIKSEKDLILEETTLSRKLEQKILDFMKKMGLVFGSLDLIVTPQNDIYFLEVNEFGQYLWIENLLPQIPLFDAFMEFIKSKDTDFRYIASKNPIKYSDVISDPKFSPYLEKVF